VLSEYSDESYAYVIEKIQSNSDPIYGEGFRRVKRFAEEEGVDQWLRWLSTKDTMPRGF
jgi:hypothetical protein